MKALILAAGIGSRLKELTKDTPKCLIPVNGKPMLAYQLDALQANGIRDVVIVLGHLGYKIKEFVSNYTKFHFTFVENNDYATTNSSYSFWLARNHLTHQPYIHLNSDIILFSELLQKIIQSPFNNVLLVDRTVQLDDSMEQVVLAGKKIMFMNKGKVSQATGRGSGIVKLSPEAVFYMLAKMKEYIDSGDKSQHCHGLIRYALTKTDFFVLDLSDSFFREINTLEELRDAETTLQAVL